LGQWIAPHKLKVQISKILIHTDNLLNFQPNLLWIILCQTSIKKYGSLDVINISIQCIDGVGHAYIEPIII
jgi:hypothetical protein